MLHRRRQSVDGPLCLSLCFTAAAAVSSPVSLELNTFHESSIANGKIDLYKTWLTASTPSVKVVLLPLSGDTDVLVSFDENATSATTADAPTWSMSGSGVEELLVRREFFCRHDLGQASLENYLSLSPPSSSSAVAPSPECYLYLRVHAFYETEDATYKVGVLDAKDPFSAGSECHPGCPLTLLANDRCDTSCNVTACAFDRGACVPQLIAACSPGCDADWLNDGYCDDACFTAECRWDLEDCKEIDIEGCADSCFSEYIDDGECDKACNVPECRWDGSDCAHGHSECYEKPTGEDYRGTVNVTVSGRPCQRWSAQFPQQHFFTHARYPNDGLGAHSACRNPGAVNDGVWCYTMEPKTRWERCDVGAPGSACNGGSGGGGGSVGPHGSGGGGVIAANRTAHHPATKARGPSACERFCPLTHALVAGGDCEGLADCSCDREACAPPPFNASLAGGSADPCGPERRRCAVSRANHERLLLILWVTMFGTSLFVLLLVLHAYQLTSPLGSPRSGGTAGRMGLWSGRGSGYSAIGGSAEAFATPMATAAQTADARLQRERELRAAEAEALHALED